MTVEIPVVITSKKTGLDQVGRDAKSLNDKLNAQAKERLRIIDLQAQKERTTDAVKRRSLQAEIATRQRSLQITRIKEQAERANTRELKQQIAAQKRLNNLTKRLNKDLDAQQQKRTLLGRAQGAVGGLGAGGAAALGAVAIAGSGALALRREAIELAKIQAQAEAQLEARLRSTGNTVGFTSKELKNLASELQATTNIGDEATISTQAMLLSFTNISGTTFPRTTKAVLDVATAMNNGATPSAEQLKNTAVQLGKALNDPEKGLSALTRVGVVFTEQQKNTIKSLVEGGKAAEAQAIILSELEREFGGSAEAAREADGAAIALTNSIGDLKEAMGSLLQPTRGQNEGLIGLTNVLTGAIGKAGDFTEVGQKLKEMHLENASATGKQIAGIVEFLPFVSTASTKFLEWTASEEDLAEAQRQLTDEQAAAGRTVNSLTDATNDNTDSIKANEEALEEAAKRLEEINDTRRGLANNLLDIEEKAQEQSTESRRTHFDGVLSATEDFTSQIESLEADAAKSRLDIQGKLQKDLKQVDKGLFQDKVKLTGEANKRIKRLEEDTARKTKNEERSRRIDTLGDERLFQLDLRNLAADGEALQIQEAIERRKIEQDIGKQKRSEEEQSEGEDLQVKIQRIKQDTQDRLREEEAQARERRSFLEEQATQDLDTLNAELALKKDAEVESLGERLNALKEANRKRLASIDETRQEEIAKLGETLVRVKDLTQQELEAMIPIAEKAGKDAGAAFAAGLESGFTRLQEVEGLTGGRQFGQAAPRPGFGQGARPGELAGFQNGGSFTIGGAGGPDSQLVQFMGSPGEQVNITPQGQGNEINVNVPITVGAGTNAAQVEAIVNRSVQGLVRDLEAMLGA